MYPSPHPLTDSFITLHIETNEQICNEVKFFANIPIFKVDNNIANGVLKGSGGDKAS